MVFRCRFFHARVYRGRHFAVLSARQGMVGSPKVRVGAATDPWLVGAVSGIATVILGVLEPIVGWLAHHFA
jgi:hypothetical protein